MPGQPGPDPRPPRPRGDLPRARPAAGEGPARAARTPSSSTTGSGSARSSRRSTPSSPRASATSPARCGCTCRPAPARSTGRRSPHSLYDYGLATYDAEDSFRHEDSAGFVRLWGLSVETWAGTQGHLGDGEPGPLRWRTALARAVRGRAGRRAARLHREPPVRPAARARRHRRLARPRARARRASASSPRPSATRCWPPSTRSSSELADGAFEFAAVRRGHPHRRRAARHRAGRRGRRQAPHRSQPQRPGRHRPPPLHEAVAARRWPSGCSRCSRCCSTGPSEAGDAYLPGLHPPAARPAGDARPPPPRPRLGAGPRRRPAARLPPRAPMSRRSAPARWPARPSRSTPTAWPPTSASRPGSRTASTRCPTATSSPRRCSPSRWSASTSRASGEELVLWTSRRVRLRPPRRRLRHRQLDAAAEEEPRHRRAGPGQGRAADRRPHRPAGHAQGPPARLQPRPPGGQGAAVRRRRPGRAWPSRRMAGSYSPRSPSTRRRCRRPPTRPTPPPPTSPSSSSSRGTPFREAHAIVGALVRDSLERRRPARRPRGRPAGLRGRATSPPRRPGCPSPRRTTPGGAGPASVAVQLDALPRPAPGRPRSARHARGAASGRLRTDGVPAHRSRPLRRGRHAAGRVQRPLPRLLRRRRRPVVPDARRAARGRRVGRHGEEGHVTWDGAARVHDDLAIAVVGQPVGQHQLRRAVRRARWTATRCSAPTSPTSRWSPAPPRRCPCPTSSAPPRPDGATAAPRPSASTGATRGTSRRSCSASCSCGAGWRRASWRWRPTAAPRTRAATPTGA